MRNHSETTRGENLFKNRLNRDNEDAYGNEAYHEESQYPYRKGAATPYQRSEFQVNDFGREHLRNPSGETDAQHYGTNQGKGPKNYRRSDQRIEEEISERLTDDPVVDASDIEVTVKESEVVLSGTVDSKTAKRRAEDLCEHIQGVTHVENRLKVKITERNSD
jgi:osmotically-inducible protein OsmY